MRPPKSVRKKRNRRFSTVMHAYPIFLSLAHARCLVVGAGSVARRKLAGMLDAGAHDILVVAPAVADPSMTSLFENPCVRFEKRVFEPGDLDGRFLVAAAAGARSVNTTVSAACRERNIVCIVADAPEEGSGINPAMLSHGPLRLALSTGGNSPAMTRRIKYELDAWLAHRYDQQIALLARVRPLLATDESLDQPARAVLFHSLAGAELGACLQAENRTGCETLLRELLPPALHDRITELLHELV